jgi:hypothetical protein
VCLGYKHRLVYKSKFPRMNVAMCMKPILRLGGMNVEID